MFRPCHVLRTAAALAAVLAAGCASTARMRFESNVPARIEESNGSVVCASAPCEWRLSRETCGLYDSSSGHFRLRAVAEDGTSLEAPVFKTCAVRQGTLVRFRFPAPGAPACGVDIVDGMDSAVVGECALGAESRRTLPQRP